jgi:alkaline phosphatase D
MDRVETPEPSPPSRWRSAAVDRRCFLGVAGAAGLLGAALLEPGAPSAGLTDPPVAGGVPETQGLAVPGDPPRLSDLDRPAGPPFMLGIASGDPAPDGMVLWTRLNAEPLAPDGGLPARDIPVEWTVAADEAMTKVAARGTAVARPGSAHTVHVKVTGLDANRWWFYRFRVQGRAAGTGRGGWVSSLVGRTRTLPAAGAAVSRLRFAVASCQDWQAGYWPAWANLVGEDLDFVLHLGDYIYEGARRSRAPRRHDGPEPVSLAAYRARHALYKTDPALQAAHRAFPFVVTWDDHDVQQNYAAGNPVHDIDRAGFEQRRAAAYQAFWEHLPLPPSTRPKGTKAGMYRRFAFGDLAAFHVLDTRQYRSDQPCGGGLEHQCYGARDPDATMTGPIQERWLFGGLDRVKTRWNVIAQQVAMTQIKVAGPFGALYNMDQWDGYVAARNRLLGFLAERRPANPVVLAGDLHSTWVSDLKADFDEPGSPTVATEFVGTSISSTPPDALAGSAELLLAVNPHIRYVDAKRRGYVRCEVTPATWRADLRTVASALRPSSATTTSATFVIESGKPGAERA